MLPAPSRLHKVLHEGSDDVSGRVGPQQYPAIAGDGHPGVLVEEGPP